jgi:hypothetical protein
LIYLLIVSSQIQQNSTNSTQIQLNSDFDLFVNSFKSNSTKTDSDFNGVVGAPVTADLDCDIVRAQLKLDPIWRVKLEIDWSARAGSTFRFYFLWALKKLKQKSKKKFKNMWLIKYKISKKSWKRYHGTLFLNFNLKNSSTNVKIINIFR